MSQTVASEVWVSFFSLLFFLFFFHFYIHCHHFTSLIFLFLFGIPYSSFYCMPLFWPFIHFAANSNKSFSLSNFFLAFFLLLLPLLWNQPFRSTVYFTQWQFHWNGAHFAILEHYACVHFSLSLSLFFCDKCAATIFKLGHHKNHHLRKEKVLFFLLF